MVLQSYLSRHDKIFGLVSFHADSFIFIALGYVYTGSDMFRSIWVRIHYGTDPLCLHGTGSKPKRYGSMWDHLFKWTHLVPDSGCDPYPIHQVPYKHKPFPCCLKLYTVVRVIINIPPYLNSIHGKAYSK